MAQPGYGPGGASESGSLLSEPRRKLIEVALPLEKINAASKYEKALRFGHPSTLHLWWARRPLATARAVLFAQLVDDPSVRHDEYRQIAVARGDDDPDDSADQMVAAERQRLFGIVERLVEWKNIGDEGLYSEARAEIMRSTDGRPPAILDPFAGGGTIPLEAQRLGLEAHASDLNPVAVLINMALIEIPPKFAERAPVFPGASSMRNHWPKATGLAEDVRRYGEWIRDEAEKRIGHLYPKAKLQGGGEAKVIAWIWARTVTCPNPACGIEMPLLRSWWLGKKPGKEAFVRPVVSGRKVSYSVETDANQGPSAAVDGTVNDRGATCFSCSSAVPFEYVRSEAKFGRMSERLMATVSEGTRSRVYLTPTPEQEAAAEVAAPESTPPGDIPDRALGFRVQAYGKRKFTDLFTNRQLMALKTLVDLVEEARAKILEDARVLDVPDGARLSDGGTGANAYADAVATYLGIAVSRLTDYSSSFATWSNHPKNEVIVHVFGRQAIQMVWDFAESAPLGNGNGSFISMTKAVGRSLEHLPAAGVAEAGQNDAAHAVTQPYLLSTDPPYYDNIGYSDLSDFFYVWLRAALRSIHPELFSTVLVPKSEELVANQFRHGGPAGAQDFFETGFESFFEAARSSATSDFPIAVYYAFKQTRRAKAGESSPGWETILGAIVRSGWTVTATWPVNSEYSGRMVANNTAALASSIVLALRPRPTDAQLTDRSGFIQELRAKLPSQLRDLQQGGVAAVDLQQAAIGPGIGIFSKFSKVIDPTGQPMSVHDALVQINDILGEVLSGQEGDFDSDSRWCVSWFEEFGFDKGEYGIADTLARAKNTSVDTLARNGAVDRAGSKVWLKDFAALPDKYDPTKDDRISIWEVVLHLAKTLDRVGLDEAARILAGARERGVDVTAAKELAYLLYAIAGRRKLTSLAVALNLLTSSWSDLVATANRRAEGRDTPMSTTIGFDFDALEDEN